MSCETENASHCTRSHPTPQPPPLPLSQLTSIHIIKRPSCPLRGFGPEAKCQVPLGEIQQQTACVSIGCLPPQGRVPRQHGVGVKVSVFRHDLALTWTYRLTWSKSNNNKLTNRHGSALQSCCVASAITAPCGRFAFVCLFVCFCCLFVVVSRLPCYKRVERYTQASLCTDIDKHKNMCTCCPIPTAARAVPCLQLHVLPHVCSCTCCPIPTAARDVQCLQLHLLSHVYSCTCCPIPTAARAVPCLQLHVLSHVCSCTCCPIPTAARDVQCLQLHLLSHVCSCSCCPMSTAARAVQSLQLHVLSHVYSCTCCPMSTAARAVPCLQLHVLSHVYSCTCCPMSTAARAVPCLQLHVLTHVYSCTC